PGLSPPAITEVIAPAKAGWSRLLEASLRTIDENGDGSVVDEVDAHVGAESAGSHRDSGGADGVDERIKHRQPLGGIGGRVERRAATMAGRGGDREVAHQQHRTVDLANVGVEVLVAVAKDSQADQFLRG